MADQLGLFDARPASPAGLASAALRVRESRRARYLTLRLLPPHTLELVVPHGTRPVEVNAFVAEHASWIENARRELARYRPVRSEGLPTRIALAAVGEEWSVRYRHEPTGKLRYRSLEGTLEIATPDANRRGADAVLHGWLLDQADYHLAPWLLREATIVGRRPRSVQVRLQRTRWGSCSSRGTVSLNAALMFLAPELVRYLFVHELCHLIALDHSRKFWAAVERFEPDYEALDRRLTRAWAEIPLWAHPLARSR
jgi:predicted metal-dependent hydrolase